MAKHVGVKLPEDLINLLKRKNSVGVLATFSEKGVPNTTPLQCIFPKGEESLLITIHKEHTGYHNMVWQKKVMLCFLGEGVILGEGKHKVAVTMANYFGSKSPMSVLIKTCIVLYTGFTI